MSDTLVGDTTPAAAPPARPQPRAGADLVTLLGLAVVLGLAFLAFYLNKNLPVWTKGTDWERIVRNIDFPIYAIAVGLVANVVLSLVRLRERFASAYRTEFFIKTGLILLGLSINFKVLVSAASPAIVQAFIVITVVFFGTWFIAGAFKLDQKLRALLSAAVSICGVSAAIAAAGAVKAKREALAYAAALVVIFALPSIFLLPWLADVLNLSDPVAGAWIGGNIDTTAAVAAAGAIVGDDALSIATIVKATQNVLIGVVAVALTLYFALRVEKVQGAAATAAKRSAVGQLWTRFPKFVLGFVAAAALGTWYATTHTAAENSAVQAIGSNLRTWFLILAFVSIGLEFKVRGLRQAGWKPIVVFAIATVLNLAVALGAASLLFHNFTIE